MCAADPQLVDDLPPAHRSRDIWLVTGRPLEWPESTAAWTSAYIRMQNTTLPIQVFRTPMRVSSGLLVLCSHNAVGLLTAHQSRTEACSDLPAWPFAWRHLRPSTLLPSAPARPLKHCYVHATQACRQLTDQRSPACTSAWKRLQVTTLPNQVFSAPMRISSGLRTLVMRVMAARSVSGTPSNLSIVSTLHAGNIVHASSGAAAAATEVSASSGLRTLVTCIMAVGSVSGKPPSLSIVSTLHDQNQVSE